MDDIILEQGAQRYGKGSREQQKIGNGARSKRNYRESRQKVKKEQGAERAEKGAVKIGKKDRAPKKWKGAGGTG